MKFSEAIRLGAMTGPQVFDSMFGPDGVGACAVGAAYRAAGIEHSANTFSVILDTFLSVRTAEKFSCPHEAPCAYRSDAFLGLIEMAMHLNDRHRWTREQIADWVEAHEVSETRTSSTAEATVGQDSLAATT